MTFESVALDYDILKLLWWGILGLIIICFAIFEGFDMGVAILLPAIGKNDIQRRILINSIGPVWESNQVWLILAGGAAFAAWPLLYSVSFFVLYIPILLILFALILRPVGFEFRNKLENKNWRQMWDIALFLGGLIPSFIFGVAIGNLFIGIPFDFDPFLRISSNLYFLDLLSPFPIICGVTSTCLMIQQGAVYLCLKTDGIIHARSRNIAFNISFLIICFLVINIWLLKTIDGYILESLGSFNNSIDPLSKQVTKIPNGWIELFLERKIYMIIPIMIGTASLLLVPICIKFHHYIKAFCASSMSITMILVSCGILLFPFLLPSNINPKASLTIWDACSSHFTLFIMLLVTVVFIPLISMYVGFAYYILREKVTESHIEKNSKALY